MGNELKFPMESKKCDQSTRIKYVGKLGVIVKELNDRIKIWRC